MKKPRKKAKGMTLIEMIISIAIFAVMGGLLILVGTHIDAKRKATNNLKTKISSESPFAANHLTEYIDSEGNKVDIPADDVEITVKMDVIGQYYTRLDPTDPTSPMDPNPKPINNPEVKLNAKKYKTEAVINDGKTAEEIAAAHNAPAGELNFQFIEFEQPTTTTP